jgi:murein DD-endopeptidase MepM/ murein hydrolase activator NlpD
MSVDRTGPSGQTPPAAPDAARQQIARLAAEFEAILMTQMIREMRRSMLADDSNGSEEGFGHFAMTDTVDIELGRALARVGGFGLAAVLTRAFDRTLARPAESTANGDPPRDVTAVPPTNPAPAGAGQPDALPTMTPAEREPGASGEALEPIHVPHGTVTSGFGWRRDPLTGETRFHRGIDVAQPYGSDVSAAAAGVVIAAGVQGGYGTTVLIDHGNGQQTRYAHLSEVLVRAGDTVGPGQVIGRTGDSGRATGPHLHFELTAGGRAVDPTAVWAKENSASAD